jgi:hypothetical protein
VVAQFCSKGSDAAARGNKGVLRQRAIASHAPIMTPHLLALKPLYYIIAISGDLAIVFAIQREGLRPPKPVFARSSYEKPTTLAQLSEKADRTNHPHALKRPMSGAFGTRISRAKTLRFPRYQQLQVAAATPKTCRAGIERDFAANQAEHWPVTPSFLCRLTAASRRFWASDSPLMATQWVI